MYPVHTFFTKYVLGTYFFSRVCTGMYQVQTDQKMLVFEYVLDEKSMYRVHTSGPLNGMYRYVPSTYLYILFSIIWDVISLVFEGYIHAHTGDC